MKMFFATKTLLTSALALSTATAQLRDDLEFSFNSVKLPFPVSDVMANYMEDDDGEGFVIITGGCNSPNGNERVNFDGEDLFACLSTSIKTLKFNPFDNTFQILADAPHERQRHAAAVVNGELYVLGGRDSNDELVTAIDSFNPKTNTWTTRGELPADVVTSDLTAWAWMDFIYVAGGFQTNYTAVGTTYRLNVADSPTDFESMAYEELSSSENPRGDFHAVVWNGAAYLAGGITHLSDWCVGLTTTERYHMASDTWQEIAPLEVGRADMAVAVLNGKIVAMGGEFKPEDCIDVSDPAYGSFPVDRVDVLLNPESKNAKWVEFEQFQDQRFRFAAAVVPAQNRIYTFGGQLPFDFTCDCFPTSDLVGVGTEVYKEEDSNSLSGGAIAAIVLGSLAGIIVILFGLRWCMLKRNKEALENKDATELEVKEDGVME